MTRQYCPALWFEANEVRLWSTVALLADARERHDGKEKGSQTMDVYDPSGIGQNHSALLFEIELPDASLPFPNILIYLVTVQQQAGIWAENVYRYDVVESISQQTLDLIILIWTGSFKVGISVTILLNSANLWDIQARTAIRQKWFC